jgi:hypothetical protein
VGRRTAYVDQMVIYDCSLAVVLTLRSTEFDPDNRVIRRDGKGAISSYPLRSHTLPRYIRDVLC